MPEPEADKQEENSSQKSPNNSENGRLGQFGIIVGIVGGIVATIVGIRSLLPVPTPIPPTPIPTQITPSPTPPPITPSPTPQPVQIQYIDYAPKEKPDCEHEYVEIINVSDEPQDMTLWTLEDEDNHSYEFPKFSLPPGKTVKVWTTIGTDTQTDLYGNCEQSIWNNKTSDTATLKNNQGEIIDALSYEP